MHLAGGVGDVMRRGSGGARGQVGSPGQLGEKGKGEWTTLMPSKVSAGKVLGKKMAVRNDTLLIRAYDLFFFGGGDGVYQAQQESRRLKVSL